MPPSRFAVLLLSALLLPFASASANSEEAILLIEQASGGTGVQRDGKRLLLKAGEALQEQDQIITDATGRMTLRLGRHGFIEVGANAEVGIERLPYATYARDLKSIFSIARGYLRLVWKYPQTSTHWPLFVYMSGHRISLVSGEYFFQSGSSQRVCVAAGQVALQAVGGTGLDSIKPPACAVLAAGQPAQMVPRNPDDWIAVRRSFDLEAKPADLLAVEPLRAPALPVAAAPVAVPTPAAVPRAATAPLGPVAAAPILSAPVAPRTTVTPALPRVEAEPTATAPVVIGEVQSTALAAVAKPALPPAAKSSGKWSLNVASYAEAALAEREVTRLRQAGYAALTAPTTINGRIWHRVQVAGYVSEEAANAAAVEINSRFGIANIWVLRP